MEVLKWVKMLKKIIDKMIVAVKDVDNELFEQCKLELAKIGGNCLPDVDELINHLLQC